MHLKATAAPRSWSIRRRGVVWTTRPRGPVGPELALPLALVLRLLKQAKTTKEAKAILTRGQVLVNSRQIRDPNFGIGLMDVLSLPALGKAWRVLLDRRRKLFFAKTEKAVIVRRVEKKRTVRHGLVQLGLFGGASLIIGKAGSAEERAYQIGDSLVFELGKEKPVALLKAEPGAAVYLIGGAHTGQLGRLLELRAKTALIELELGVFETPKSYVYVVGKKEPVIELK